MSRIRFITLAAFLAAALSLTGCSPAVMCLVETVVYPDYTCRRVTRMEAFPNPRFPQQRPRMTDYFQFPPAELYDTYMVQQDKALFAGAFESFDQIPNDLMRNTPGAAQPAANLLSFRVMDLVFFILADFDETLTDIVVSQSDGEAALGELLRLAVPEVMSVLNAKYGSRFDLSRLESWLNNDLPLKLQRIYNGAWAIHSAKRSGVTSPGEEYEYYMFLKAEAKREGLELAEPGTPDMQQENVRRLKEYAVRLAQQLCTPRQGTGVTKEMLSDIALDDLAASVQRAITARHGSINAFVGKIAALVPRAFGAYLTGTVMPIYMLPETTYQFRLRIPGSVIQSNGVRELNGDLVWSFSDRDLAFTGQSMWARSIFIRDTAVYALGLRGFPSSLADVDRMFGLCLSPAGTPREGLLEAMRQAVAARSQSPIEALANNPSSPDAQAAREVLELFDRHRRQPAPTSASPAQGTPPAHTPPPASPPGDMPLPEPAPSGPANNGSRPAPAGAPAAQAAPAANENTSAALERLTRSGNPLEPMQPLGTEQPGQPAAAPLEPPSLPPVQ